jgi:HK97 family phage major capsid protein
MNDSQQITTALNGLVDIQKHLIGLPWQSESIGDRILGSQNYADFKNGKTEIFKFALTPYETKTAIVSTSSLNDPLVASYTPTIDPGTRRNIFIRDLLTTFPTENGAIEMPVKTSATVAAIQQSGSPVQLENVTMTEAAYTFSTSFEAVKTIGHFIPASSQIFEDAGTLDGLINTELLHGLAQAEQNQILNGTGEAHELSGLIPGATAYTVQSPNLTNEADVLRDAMKQISLADFRATEIILNPADWHTIETGKTATGDDSYAGGDPRIMAGPSLWGIPVLETNAVASGTFLIGDFRRAAILFDRQQPEILISRHDDDNFQKNMVTVSATQRLALVVTNPTALVTGSL